MIRCPKCGTKFPMEDGQAEGEWEAIIRMASSFGTQATCNLVWEYVELFGVVPTKNKGKKILRLLQEISALMQNEKFLLQKREYSISKNGIVEALRVCCNKGFDTMLQNHNYLKRVMVAVAEREQKKSRDLEDRLQRKREEIRVAGCELRVEEGEKLAAEELRRRAGDFLKGM